MSQTTILVIDDSATIRRLVDNILTNDGYRIVLAANAEQGIELAATERPDVILLDHQLPGTTGHDVCLKLVAEPQTAGTPVVVSSTLRNKAYAEYTDLPNVVDMLPKPYTEDLLRTTISNALETGQLIVQSQTSGTAVPEVIDGPDEASLSGSFQVFQLREIIDLLNNGRKTGVLEVETESGRSWFHLESGRIQAALASGIDISLVANTLPESIATLAPILRMTFNGRACSELDGLVELLDRNVLDPRLLKTLLRHQASMLAWHCLNQPLKRFRFEADRAAPRMFQQLPLDVSLTALLVDAALKVELDPSGAPSANTVFGRTSFRGQNLDRAGLAATHLKVLSQLNEPRTIAELQTRTGLEADVLIRVLRGFELANLVESRTRSACREIIVMDESVDSLPVLRLAFASRRDRYTPRFVRDALSLQALLKRSRPDAVLLPMDSYNEPDTRKNVERLLELLDTSVKLIGVCDEQLPPGTVASLGLNAELRRPYDAQHLLTALDAVFENELAPESVSNADAARQSVERSVAEQPV